jgi:hypothetical protein
MTVYSRRVTQFFSVRLDSSWAFGMVGPRITLSRNGSWIGQDGPRTASRRRASLPVDPANPRNVLLRIHTHPAERTAELIPREWKTRFGPAAACYTRDSTALVG